MKKIFIHIMAFAVTLAFLTSNIYASSFTFNASAKDNSVKPGETVELTIGVSSIDISGGISTLEGILEYSHDIFEDVMQNDITPLNGWSTTYNDENSDSNGKFFSMYMGSTSATQDIFKVKLKVKTNIEPQSTNIIIKNISTNDGETLITNPNKTIPITIEAANTGDNSGGDGDDNQGGNQGRRWR